jgi:CcmD family protein
MNETTSMTTSMTTRTRHWFARLALPPLLAVAALLPGSAALAQEYVKVENATREHLPAPQFVAGAYGFIWVAILVYVFVVARRLARTRQEIAELRSRVERAAGPAERR